MKNVFLIFQFLDYMGIDEEEFNGEVSDSSILIDLIALVRTIKKDRFFKNKVQQIYVNDME